MESHLLLFHIRVELACVVAVSVHSQHPYSRRSSHSRASLRRDHSRSQRPVVHNLHASNCVESDSSYPVSTDPRRCTSDRRNLQWKRVISRRNLFHRKPLKRIPLCFWVKLYSPPKETSEHGHHPKSLKERMKRCAINYKNESSMTSPIISNWRTWRQNLLKHLNKPSESVKSWKTIALDCLNSFFMNRFKQLGYSFASAFLQMDTSREKLEVMFAPIGNKTN